MYCISLSNASKLNITINIHYCKWQKICYFLLILFSYVKKHLMVCISAWVRVTFCNDKIFKYNNRHMWINVVRRAMCFLMWVDIIKRWFLIFNLYGRCIHFVLLIILTSYEIPHQKWIVLVNSNSVSIADFVFTYSMSKQYHRYEVHYSFITSNWHVKATWCMPFCMNSHIYYILDDSVYWVWFYIK